MNYITTKTHLPLIVEIISKNALYQESVPDYLSEKKGVDKLQSIFEHMRSGYYRTFYMKASYMFVSIISAHAFSNGNKRIALACLLFLMKLNNRYPEYDMAHDLYVLTLQTAGSQCFSGTLSFDDSKRLVEKFLQTHCNKEKNSTKVIKIAKQVDEEHGDTLNQLSQQ
jgi:death-on-curing family protein